MFRRPRHATGIFATLCLLGSVAIPEAASAAPRVVASVKPLHSIVAAIMKDVATPGLIVKGAASPHTYNLRPSDARMLQDADIVFWIGHGLEAFLEKPLEALAADATVVEMEDKDGIATLPFREGGPFEAHDHGDHEDGHDHAGAGEDGHEHEHGGNDMHLWLDPRNAEAMALTITETLAKADPANAARYQGNLKTFNTELAALDEEISRIVAPVKGKPFIVFHDAYQYFERRYGVTVAGSVTVSPEQIPGAERLSAIHAKMAELGASCIFAEPQFQSSLLKVVAEGTQARTGMLDPEGGALAEGPDLYAALMRNLAISLRDCLSGQ